MILLLEGVCGHPDETSLQVERGGLQCDKAYPRGGGTHSVCDKTSPWVQGRGGGVQHDEIWASKIAGIFHPQNDFRYLDCWVRFCLI